MIQITTRLVKQKEGYVTRLAALRAKVEARVAELIVPAMFERALKVHEKRAWRDCECDWCERKRHSHARLQFSPFGMPRATRENWRHNEVQFLRRDLREEEKRILS